MFAGVRWNTVIVQWDCSFIREVPFFFGDENMRKRPLRIIVPVTAEEKETITQNAHAAGTTNVSAYARKMLIDGYIIRADMSEIKKLAQELGYLSRNINQIAKRANETRSIYKDDIKDLQRDYASVKNEILKFLLRSGEKIVGNR